MKAHSRFEKQGSNIMAAFKITVAVLALACTVTAQFGGFGGGISGGAGGNEGGFGGISGGSGGNEGGFGGSFGGAAGLGGGYSGGASVGGYSSGGFGGNSGAASGGSGGHYDHHEEYYHHPKYNFQYGVHDGKTHDIKKHSEHRDGDKTEGEYSFVEADGTTRTVKYHVHGKSGFVATVHRSGHAVHPQHQVHHQPSYHHGGYQGGFGGNAGLGN